MHQLCRSKSSNMKLTDLHFISDKNHSNSINYGKKPLYSKYRKICKYITLWSCSNFENLMLLFKYLKARSVLYNYLNYILLNREKERTNIQFNF